MAPDGLRIPPGDVQIKPQTPAAKPAAPPVDPDRALKEDLSAAPQKKIDPEFLEKITSELNNDFRIFNTALSFSIDDNTGTTVIKILDRETEKVIREVPPSQLLKLAAKLTEVIGRIVDETV
ncbi:flagellar protein FlaG [candidate division KSB1 bacterium]